MRLSALYATAALLSLAACNAADDSRPAGYEVRMATLQRDGGDVRLSIDNVGVRAVGDSTLLVQAGVRRHGQRLIASYAGTQRPDGTGVAVLYGVRPVLTKAFSPAPATREDSASLGADATDVAAAWTAGGHLNVGLRLSPAAEGAPHLLSVCLTGETRDGLPVARLWHNLNGNAAGTGGTLSYASFALPEDGAADGGCWLRYVSGDGAERTLKVAAAEREIPLGDSGESGGTADAR